MTEVNASIPLQVQQFKPVSPSEVLTLKDLATRAQMNQMNLQNAQGVRGALADQSNMDPASGRILPGGLSKITQFNPQLGLQLAQQQEQLRLQDLANNQ